MGKTRERELNFEINLLPVISLLAVLISFLLLTAVWINVGTLKFSQAFGTESSSDKPTASLMAQIENDGRIYLLLKNEDTGKGPQRWFISPKQDTIAWNQFEKVLSEIKTKYPELNSATIMPDRKIRYQDVIHIMDSMKQSQIHSIGISTL